MHYTFMSKMPSNFIYSRKDIIGQIARFIVQVNGVIFLVGVAILQKKKLGHLRGADRVRGRGEMRGLEGEVWGREEGEEGEGGGEEGVGGGRRGAGGGRGETNWEGGGKRKIWRARSARRSKKGGARETRGREGGDVYPPVRPLIYTFRLF